MSPLEILDQFDQHLRNILVTKEEQCAMLSNHLAGITSSPLSGEKKTELRIGHRLALNRIEGLVNNFSRKWIDAIPELKMNDEDAVNEFLKDMATNATSTQESIMNEVTMFSTTVSAAAA